MERVREKERERERERKRERCNGREREGGEAVSEREAAVSNLRGERERGWQAGRGRATQIYQKQTERHNERYTRLLVRERGRGKKRQERWTNKRELERESREMRERGNERDTSLREGEKRERE